MKTTHRRNLINLLVAVIPLGILSGCGKKEDAPLPPAPPTVAVDATTQPAPVATPDAEFEKLKGKWLRPDGGYVIEIRSVEPGGKMDAAYFNPQPINVAKAEASQDGGIVTVFIELSGVNYPGSTYKLTFDPGDDHLKGTYYQAVAKETYEVFFARMKP